jgi:aspartate aminotransferase-like enzyme
MIGHRGPEYSELHARVVGKLQRLLRTRADVFLATCSASGVMEAVIRNLSAKRILACSCGVFSERWFEFCAANGKAADPLRVEWGTAIKPEMVDTALRRGEYDLVLCVHNETSTGVMNPIAEIGDVVRKCPGVLFAVDAVSSMALVPINVDDWNLDVCLAGSQKGFALPPGLSILSVSAAALERASKVRNRGAYLDFVEFKQFAEKNQTPTTPAISLIHALNFQLDQYFAEGLEEHWSAVRAMAEECRAWAKERGLALFPERGYESITLTVTHSQGFDMSEVKREMAVRGYTIDDGQGVLLGRLRGKTLRVSHMGCCSLEDLRDLLHQLDEVLKFK